MTDAPRPRPPWAAPIRRFSLSTGRKWRVWVGIGGLIAPICALVATIHWPPRPILLWNATSSSPVGLYWLSSPDRIKSGDHVAAWAPYWARTLGSKRRYIPLNVPLVKRVAAVAGDEICVHGQTIFLNGAPAARRRKEDALGRPMPIWEGCERLGNGEYFLFDPGQPDAFDGRYFGITGSEEIIGRARLIWRA
jgi:conjugative transfer signal peptidase TraF